MLSDVYLYILMRTDLASMNPGKAVAQGAHAANQCVFEALKGGHDPVMALLREWEAQTSAGFGTTITLGVNGQQLAQTISLAQALGFHAGVTHDPTYPLVDGQVVHLLPLDTCGYVLARKDDMSFLLGNYSLMP